jgi:hypothetical protein
MCPSGVFFASLVATSHVVFLYHVLFLMHNPIDTSLFATKEVSITSFLLPIISSSQYRSPLTTYITTSIAKENVYVGGHYKVELVLVAP